MVEELDDGQEVVPNPLLALGLGDDDLVGPMVANGEFPGGLTPEDLLLIGEPDRQELARRRARQEGLSL